MKTNPFRLAGLALFLAMTPVALFADTVTWTGGNGGFGYQWVDSCWDTGTNPGAADTARFVDIGRFQSQVESGKNQSIALTQDETVAAIRFDNTYGISIQGGHTLFLGALYACESDIATTNSIKSPTTLSFAAVTNTIDIGAGHVLQIGSPCSEPNGAGNEILRTGAGTLILSGTSLGFTGDAWFREGRTIISSGAYPTLKGNVRIGGDSDRPALVETTSSTHPTLSSGTDLSILPGGTFRGPVRASAATWAKEYLSVDHGVLDGANSLNLYSTDFSDTPERGRQIHLTGGVLTNLLLGISYNASDNPTLSVHAADIPSVLAGSLDPNPLTFAVERGTAPVDFVGLFRVTGHGPIHKTGPGIMAIDTPDGIGDFQTGTKTSTVREGMLLLNNISGSAMGTNDVEVLAGATIGGTGTQYGDFVNLRGLKGNIRLMGSFDARAVFAPGDIDRTSGRWIPGTFTVGDPVLTNNVISTGYAELRCHVDATGASCLAVNGRLELSATDRLAIVGPAKIRAGTYTLATFTNGFANRFADVTINGADITSAVGSVSYLDAQGEPIAAASYDGAGSIVFTVHEKGTVIVIR